MQDAACHPTQAFCPPPWIINGNNAGSVCRVREMLLALSSRFDATSRQIMQCKGGECSMQDDEGAVDLKGRVAAQPASPWVSFPSSPLASTACAPGSKSSSDENRFVSGGKARAACDNNSGGSSSQRAAQNASKLPEHKGAAWARPPPHWAHLSRTPLLPAPADAPHTSSTPSGPAALSGGGAGMDDGSNHSSSSHGGGSVSSKEGKSKLGMGSAGSHNSWPPTWAAWESLHGWRQVRGGAVLCIGWQMLLPPSVSSFL